MTKHHGQLLEHFIRNGALSISELSRELRVSRSTIYHWFRKSTLDRMIISRASAALGYDISSDFPDFADKNDPAPTVLIVAHQSTGEKALDVSENDIWKTKYLLLLEEHKEALDRYSKNKYADRAS